MSKPNKITLRSQFKPGQAIPIEDWHNAINDIPSKSKQQIQSEQSRKQIIHYFSLKSSSTDGYINGLNAIQGTIIAMATTNEHLIVVTQ